LKIIDKYRGWVNQLLFFEINIKQLFTSI
jgi:hypothetical protein